MNNIEATITNIKAQLIAHGWEIGETLFDDGSPDDCHLELTRGEDERKGFGRFPRLYCYTEAYTAVTGREWQAAIVKPTPRPF